jgi:hypothetical protein
VVAAVAAVAAADIITVAEATGAGTDMAYTKDKDRQTRGVGAIASLDHALPNRQVRRRRVLEDTRRHDRAMAAVTKGALGAVRDPIVAAAQRGVFNRVGSTQVPVPTGVRPRSGSTPARPPRTGVIVHDYRTGATGGATQVATGGAWNKLGTMSTKLGTIVAQPAAPAAPDPAPPAAPTPPATPAPTSTPTTSSGGGGGGGGGSSGGRGAATSGPAGPAIDPLPSMPDIPAATEDNTTRNLLIAGGAALAAYLLFIRGRQ